MNSLLNFDEQRKECENLLDTIRDRNDEFRVSSRPLIGSEWLYSPLIGWTRHPETFSFRDWLELLDFKEEQSSFFEDYSHPVKDSERKIKHNKSMAIWTDKMHNAQDCIYFICSWKSQKIVHWCQNSWARSLASEAKWSVSAIIFRLSCACALKRGLKPSLSNEHFIW